MSVRVETDDLASFVDPRDNVIPAADPDLLSLRSGTPVRLMIAKRDESSGSVNVTPLSSLFDVDRTTLGALLVDQKRRWTNDPDPVSTAKREVDAIEQSIGTLRVPDLFYTRCVNHKFSADDGWSADIELVNYNVINLPDNLSAADEAADAALRPLITALRLSGVPGVAALDRIPSIARRR
jgi:hypothetical protein